MAQGLSELCGARGQKLTVLLRSKTAHGNAARDSSTTGLRDLEKRLYFPRWVNLVNPPLLQCNLCLASPSIWLLSTERTSHAPALIHLGWRQISINWLWSCSGNRSPVVVFEAFWHYFCQMLGPGARECLSNCLGAQEHEARGAPGESRWVAAPAAQLCSPGGPTLFCYQQLMLTEVVNVSLLGPELDFVSNSSAGLLPLRSISLSCSSHLYLLGDFPTSHCD